MFQIALIIVALLAGMAAGMAIGAYRVNSTAQDEADDLYNQIDRLEEHIAKMDAKRGANDHE